MRHHERTDSVKTKTVEDMTSAFFFNLIGFEKYELTKGHSTLLSMTGNRRSIKVFFFKFSLFGVLKFP